VVPAAAAMRATQRVWAVQAAMARQVVANMLPSCARAGSQGDHRRSVGPQRAGRQLRPLLVLRAAAPACRRSSWAPVAGRATKRPPPLLQERRERQQLHPALQMRWARPSQRTWFP
jgi:hypothetical protein